MSEQMICLLASLNYEQLNWLHDSLEEMTELEDTLIEVLIRVRKPIEE